MSWKRPKESIKASWADVVGAGLSPLVVDEFKRDKERFARTTTVRLEGVDTRVELSGTGWVRLTPDVRIPHLAKPHLG